MLINEPLHLLSNIFPRGIFVQRPPDLCTDPDSRLRTRFTQRSGPNRSVHSDPVLGLHSRSSSSWACSFNTPPQAQLEVPPALRVLRSSFFLLLYPHVHLRLLQLTRNRILHPIRLCGHFHSFSVRGHFRSFPVPFSPSSLARRGAANQAHPRIVAICLGQGACWKYRQLVNPSEQTLVRLHWKRHTSGQSGSQPQCA